MMEGMSNSNNVEDVEPKEYVTGEQEAIAVDHNKKILEILNIESTSEQGLYLDSNVLNFLDENEIIEIAKELDGGKHSSKIKEIISKYMNTLSSILASSLGTEFNAERELSKKTLESLRIVLSGDYGNEISVGEITGGVIEETPEKIAKEKEQKALEAFKNNLITQNEMGFLEIGSEEEVENVFGYLKDNPDDLKLLESFIENKDKVEANLIIERITDEFYEAPRTIKF